MTTYIVLAGAVGAIVFSLVFLLMLIKGGSLKIPFIGMAAFVILMAAGVVLTVMGGKGDKPDTADQSSQAVESEAVDTDTPAPETEGQEEDDAPPTDRVGHTEHITENGDMLVIFKNNDNRLIPEFEAEVTFFDEGKKMISVDTDGHDAVLPGAEVVSIMEAPEKYDSYEISVKIDDKSRVYDNLTDSLAIEDNATENGVVARFTNNSDKELEELEVVAVYYKDGKIIDADEEEKTSIASGDFVTIQFFPPIVDGRGAVPYDEYKIYINQAHNFNY